MARAVRTVCPAWLADQVDDLTQIATARVLHRMRATAGTVVFQSGYLYRAAYTVLIDEIRRRRRLREEALEVDAAPASGAVDAERLTASRDIREALAGCLSKQLPARRRAVVLHLQGHSFAETALLLECAHKKAENLVYRGLADLRACLKARGVTP
jgi:RNA polymerase sigma-70 factor (ECF subfamily)